MPDDSTKPILPRRPYQRRPEKIKTPRKKDLANPEQVESDCLALTVIEKACAVICIERDKESAAIELKMSLNEVQEIMDSAPVRLYLQKLQAEEIVQMAKVKIRVMRKVKICKGTIEQRLMELANMDPEKTKGSIDGQVKALNTLAARFGYGKDVDPTENMTPEELQALVMKKAKVIEGNRTPPVN